MSERTPRPPSAPASLDATAPSAPSAAPPPAPAGSPATPAPWAGDVPITDAVLRKHKISAAEYEVLLGALGRAPSYTELGVFSVMWSEHCSYKSSRLHLKRLPTTGPRVIQGPGENAGVVDIGDGFAAVFKMESHNHPSFIEPYQGAATGVGGILRDVFTMGARPIAGLNSLRFGRVDHPRTAELLRGVVAGIGGYGNCIGVPTVGGEVQFDGRYDGNILVNAFTCGVARTDRIFYGRAAGLGNPILYIGAKTGRDGIHGATMASDEFSAGGPSQRPTMQVGDPFMGKLLLEACLDLFATDALEGIQDMGAAGLTSSSVEMAGRAQNGIELDLDKVPRRARAMTPYEILLSESQERMLLVAKKGREGEVLALCKKWELDAAVIGHVTDTGRWVIKATPGYDPLDDGSDLESRAGAPAPRVPVVVCDLPTDALTDKAPLYDRPRKKDAGHAASIAVEASEIPLPADLGEALVSLLGTPNLGSRAWIWRQYDHIVRGGTVVKPGSDAAIVRVPCERDGVTVDKHLAFAVDCNGRMCELAPRVGAAMAVAEVCRNLVCSGAEPIGLSDCLNFGNPERPEIMDQISEAIDGLADACRALGVPIVSGNVSLYNETDGRAILPTPGMAGVGLLASGDDRLTQWFKDDGHGVLLLGDAECTDPAWLGGTELLHRALGRVAGGPPSIDLEAERKLQGLVLRLARDRVLASAHDVSEGGLLVALAECCVTGPEASADRGVDVLVPGAAPATDTSAPAAKAKGGPTEGLATVVALFGERPSRVVVSAPADQVAHVRAAAERAGVPATLLGHTGGVALVARDSQGKPLLSVAPARLRQAREHCFDTLVGDA